MIKFLDCTLRDGGYYNNWDFELARAEELLSALNKSKVDIIEIGYKSPVKENSYVGLFKNCNENYLDFLSKGDYSKYCFMIDIKEFLVEDEINYFELEKYIRNSEDSIFSLVRLASHYATVKHIPKLTK